MMLDISCLLFRVLKNNMMSGRDMKKIQGCDDLTDQQKKTRIEWIIAELQDQDILAYNYVYDRDKLVIGEPDEVISQKCNIL